MYSLKQSISIINNALLTRSSRAMSSACGSNESIA
ncbi:Uncharacterised protein [Vibrio cholerae]|nr:Uncharacterised protein [Vibrio cholerae]CSI15312.1 Uncharacterised protein [Vibrio cholerae]CSI49265.1 Uncharacterised protein [Vibrio cholerae]